MKIKKKISVQRDAISMTIWKIFSQPKLSEKAYTYAIVASEKKMSMDEMKKLRMKENFFKKFFGY
jgi:hypothetical protein